MQINSAAYSISIQTPAAPGAVRLPAGTITQRSVERDEVRVTELFEVPMTSPSGFEGYFVLSDPQETVDLLSSRFAAPGLTTKDAINLQPSLLRAASALLGRLAVDDTKGRQHILDLYTAAKDHTLALRESSPSKSLDQLIADFAAGMEQLLKLLSQHELTGINFSTR